MYLYNLVSTYKGDNREKKNICCDRVGLYANISPDLVRIT